MAGTSTSLTLSAVDRSSTKHGVTQLRNEGFVPGVLYGFKTEPVAVAAHVHDLEKTWKRAGKTQLVSLELNGATYSVLIREIQRSPRTGKFQHVDFFAINPKHKLTADVPVVLHGESPAVSVTKVGQLLQLLTAIKVECLPSDLPPHLTVDITGLTEVDMSVTVGDIPAPKGVVILHTPLEDIVVRIVPHRVQTAAQEQEEEAAESSIAKSASEEEG